MNLMDKAKQTAKVIGGFNQCRHCANDLTHSICDLGVQPPSNYNLQQKDLMKVEEFMPLHAMICDKCWLAQLNYFEDASQLFSDDYAYFSSYSTSWLKHAKDYTDMVMERFGLNEDSMVIEIASNDGYLLQYFKQKGIKVLGIEPSSNVAKVAIDTHQIPTEIIFFGQENAQKLLAQYGKADVMLGNNVLAHVPNINDFIAGIPILLKPEGIVTFEFPSLENLIVKKQFDTIYHEHFSYLSLTSVTSILEQAGLRVFDVERLPTHGGSLRVFGCHKQAHHKNTKRVDETLHAEEQAGLKDLSVYAAYQSYVDGIKRDLLKFLIEAKEQGKTVIGYGAPAKGNTLLNYAGVKTDLLDFTVDRSPQKQGRYLPGTRIMIKSPSALLDARPDYVLILPWNLRDEISEQLETIRQWDGKFVVPIPTLEIF